VLAAILITSLVGLSLLAGLIAYLANPEGIHFDSPQEAGKVFYGWTVGIEALAMIVGIAFRVSRSLADDRKAGLWDSNRLTPLRAEQIVAGYWFGAGLRELYASIPLAACGLLIVLLSKLPIMVWVGSQILILSSAYFFALICLVASLVFERQQGALLVVALFILYPFSIIVPSRMLTNFLLPTYSIAYLFHIDDRDWNLFPHIFNVPIHPVLLSIGIQFLVGIFFWRAALRKTARPTQPLMSRWEAFALFAILVVIQQGLIWNIWMGQYPNKIGAQRVGFGEIPLLQLVYAATMFVGVIILGTTSPLPEVVRIESLRQKFGNSRSIFSRSVVGLAVALALVGGAGVFAQCIFSIQDMWRVVLAVAINLAELLVIFTLLLEFCRLRHKRLAVGFITLWLFILWVLPFILGLVFLNWGFVRASLLTPGFFALAKNFDQDWNLLFLTELAHFGIVVVLFLAWRRQWNRLLAKAS